MNLSEAMKTGIGVTLSDALGTGGLTTVVGMAIVFSVLLILMIVLYLFKVIFYKAPKTEKTVDVAPKAMPEAEAVPAEDEDEEELIAILTAAVAASLNTSTYNLQIKSYRRIKDNRPVWNREGLRETIDSRF